MNIFYTIFGPIFGALLRLCYWICQNNFVLALVLFTLIAKLLMLPLGFSQQKNTVKLQQMKPEMDAIRRKYAKDQQKQQDEMQKLYEKHNYKMSAGCLPMLIQFPIIIGLYGVIYAPMTYILQKTAAEVVSYAEKIASLVPDNKAVQAVIEAGAANYDPNTVGRGAEIVVAQLNNLIDFNLFGVIDLSGTPDIRVFGWLWLIPLFVAVSQILSSYLSMRMSGQEVTGTTKYMVFGMPLISVIFSFMFPAAIGFYWTLNSVLQIGQTYLVKKLYSPEREEKRLAAKRERERAEKMDRLRRLHGDDDDVPVSPVSSAPDAPVVKDDPDAVSADVAEKADDAPEKLTKKQQKQLDRDRLRQSRNDR